MGQRVPDSAVGGVGVAGDVQAGLVEDGARSSRTAGRRLSMDVLKYADVGAARLIGDEVEGPDA